MQSYNIDFVLIHFQSYKIELKKNEKKSKIIRLDTQRIDENVVLYLSFSFGSFSVLFCTTGNEQKENHTYKNRRVENKWKTYQSYNRA